ncbi:hypothetical protein [Vibrio sp. WXL103]|uniref:hypothetical protein n=1 Tax=Vibrio sp. WXL103 TaxID=3450710 RepID=UPI003EC6CACF
MNKVNQPLFDRRLLSSVIGAVLLAGCNSSDSKQENPPIDWPTPEISAQQWRFDGGEEGLVAAAKLAGYYAVSERSGLAIEIRDVRQDLTHRISVEEIAALVSDMSLNHATPICGMTFTPSGRFLYLAVCDANGADGAILAYNTNTETLSDFTRIKLNSGGVKVGMHFFKSHLYVGAGDGVYRLNADKNAVYLQNSPSLDDKVDTGAKVVDIALDTVDETLYLATTKGLYRMAADGNSASRIYSSNQLQGVAFSRIYGQDSSAGLYIAEQQGSVTGVKHVSVDNLRRGGAITPQPYMLAEGNWHSFALTADGGLLYNDGQATIQREQKDTRLSFDEWMYDELAQYVAAIKGLTASGIGESPEGLLHSKLMADRAYTNSMADNVGWAIYLLMIADQVTPDPEIEPLIELLIKRHAGLYGDGLGGVKSVDGHFVRNYRSDGTPNESNPQMQVYISMKFLPAVYKAAEMYPNNANIAQYLQYLKQVLKRSGDVIRAEQRTTWESDDFGPKRMNHMMNNETWLFGELAAAQDPNATHHYGHYTYERDRFKYDDWLKGEEVIGADHSAFIVMGAPMILDHHFNDEAWAEHNRNYYAATQSETDDLGFDYFAAFSAGFSPNVQGRYHNDGPASHPDDIIHFPAVLGFGQLGYTQAVVGGYQAYRDGQRERMHSAGNDNIQLLGRWSMAEPDMVTNGLGIADFWFGAVGLAETIQPGVTQRVRNEFYRPSVTWAVESNHQVVRYSAITPRLVTGITADGQREVFGYQRSPFVVPDNKRFASFEVSDPQGDWIELDDIKGELEGQLDSSIEPRFENPYFENNLTGWQVVSGHAVVDNQMAKLTPDSGGLATLLQAVHLPLALTGTEYRVSAYVKPEGTSSAVAKLRVWWSSQPNSGLVGQVIETEYDTSSASAQILEAITLRPDNGEYLQIEYVVEGGDSDSYLFDNTSLLSRGALDPQAISNGDFEQGLSGWSSTSGGVETTIDPNLVIDGERSVIFSGTDSLQRLNQSFDINHDPDGTRYLIRFNVGQRHLSNSKFDVEVDIHNPDEGPDPDKDTMFWWDAAGVTQESGNEVTFAMRKRPGETAFNLKFRLQQRDKELSNLGDFIVIDNVRVYKEQLFDATQCTGSVTGC